MYRRKVIRRRRAALAIFVALSIAILTGYSGESGGGFFHALQRGTQEAFAPIETGTSRVLGPVGNLFGSAADAQDKNAELEKEVQQLRAHLAEAQIAVRDSGQLRAIADLRREDYFPQGAEEETARVIARSPTVWRSSITIDKGTGDGVRVHQPVIAAGGLAGQITAATSGTADVRLITDSESGVSGQVFPHGVTGVVRPVVGNPDEVLLENIESGRRVRKNALVLTSGFTSSRLESLFPRGIPIGRVSEVDPNELATYQRIHVKPFADLSQLDIVQVLTRRGTTGAAASLPEGRG